MEIRVVIISDSGQTTPYEFKSYREAADFLVQKADPELVLQPEVEEDPVIDGQFLVDSDTITQTAPEVKKKPWEIWK